MVFIDFLCNRFFYSCEKFDDYSLSGCTRNEVTALVDSKKAFTISQIICNTLNSKYLIGMQVSIRDSLGQSWSVSFGTHDIKQNHQLKKDHLMRIGSVTKIYTAALILKLAEENYLQLGQKLSKFYPGLKNVTNVTLANLLNHSSRIADIFSFPNAFIIASDFPDKKWDPHHLAEVCMIKKLKFEPGTRHSYSNANFIILGLIAEKVTGKNIFQLISEYIFEPLNLTNNFLVPYDETPPELVNGYVHHFALSLSEW